MVANGVPITWTRCDAMHTMQAMASRIETMLQTLLEHPPSLHHAET